MKYIMYYTLLCENFFLHFVDHSMKYAENSKYLIFYKINE